ncbi:MAG: endolytic transglycosylase MltG, partial [Bacteroidales bacterium]|nr:endolytic transglycosylase MltG [Bacteroidales bacterium]
IYHNTDYQGLLDTLASTNTLINLSSFDKAARNMGLDTCIKAGRYILEEGMNNKAIVRTFANGWQKPMNFTLRGYIRSMEQMAGYLGKRLECDSVTFSKALYNLSLTEELGFEPETFFGMFIPNTYEVYWTITPEEFLRRMKKEYDIFWNDSRKAKAAALKMTQDQVATLASIVIEETKYEPEMPTIAGVYLNRLRIGMPLQADPTVIFALNQEERVTRLLNKHLKIDSPYNTYTHKGLPPGPITIAPPVAIDAVLNPDTHGYLYFCAKETFDGQHNFAKTYSEHLKNARAYQRALTARQKAQAAGKPS